MSSYRVRLRRGQQGPEGPARRQGRQPRRDDQPRPAGAAGVHDHHRGVPGLPGATGDDAGRARRRGRPSTSRRSRSAMGKRLGEPDDPLLVSVRSGAKFSMPGMMETVLNVGLNDESVQGPGDADGRRAVRAGTPTAGCCRCSAAPCSGIDGRPCSTTRSTSSRSERGADDDLDLDADDLRGARRRRTRSIDRRAHRARLPAGPARAARPRRRAPSSTPGTPSGPRSTAARSGSPTTSAPPSTSARWSSATAATDSGTGVAFTRDPATGEQGVYGDYLQNAQGEDVVAGIRNTVPLADLEQLDKASYDELLAIMAHARAALPGPVRHRVHHRARQALDAADPGRQAHARRRRSGSPCSWSTRASSTSTRRCAGSTGAQLAQLMFPRFDAGAPSAS